MSRLPRNLMLALSFGQGLALLFLWRAGTGEAWLAQIPVVNFPLWTLAIAWPALLLLSLEQDNKAQVFKLVSAFSLLLILPATYIGWQASPFGEFPIYSMVFIYIVTLTVGCFKALMYLQQRATGLPLTYEQLFTYSWRNFLVTLLAGAFVLGVSGLLALWAGLFSLIGIDFFITLFSKDWFLHPILAVAFGIAVFIFRNLTGVIDNITSLLSGMMKLLLPLVLVIITLFIAALPFTGLAPLWETGRGTGLLISLNAVTLFFANAVYQTGRDMPYPPLAHRLLSPGIALLPIISALALYGLWLRIDQYGWSVDRCWAFAITILLGMFSCGYLWAIIRRRFNWIAGLARVNITMGWVVALVMLLANTPVLDFRSISVASQLNRVESGEIELAELDFVYLKRQLARPGYLARQKLAEQVADTDPDLAKRIIEGSNRALVGTTTDFWERVTYRPEEFAIPQDLRALINEVLMRPQFTGWRPDLSKEPIFIRVDLNNDDGPEYVLIGANPNNRRAFGLCFFYTGYTWVKHDITQVLPPFIIDPETLDIDVLDALRHGNIETVAPTFQNLKIGELIMRVMEPARAQ